MRSIASSVTCTSRELDALLSSKYNLSDAHARYELLGSQQTIVNNLQHAFHHAFSTPYRQLVDEFNQVFYELAGQRTLLNADRSPMLCYSASLCIQIVASYLRVRRSKVALIEPVFDNVPGILRAEGIDLIPLPEERLSDIASVIDRSGVTTAWIVLPNNPTGTAMTSDDFYRLVQACRARNVMLVLDCCFRFFAPEMASWDQYAMLEEAGISYAIIEDTGKTWPTLDLKVGILHSSADIYDALYCYYDNHLENVSPFILHLLTEFMQDSRKYGLDETVRKVPLENRKLILNAIEGTAVKCETSGVPISVAWLRIEDDNFPDSLEICERASHEGIAILPGTHFFWHEPVHGRRFFRIALVRDTSYVQRAMVRLRKVLTQ